MKSNCCNSIYETEIECLLCARSGHSILFLNSPWQIFNSLVHGCILRYIKYERGLVELMHHNTPQMVSLNSGEQRLLDQITFGLGHGNDEILKKSCEAASTLTILLLQREAIPEIRVRFFTEPEFNIGVGKSRFQVFESEGVTGYAVFSDPRFMEYLHYFIYGPMLPVQVIAEFCNMAYPYGYISGGDIKDLRELAISLVCEYKLVPRDVACEFFKLVLECGMDVYFAQSIKDIVSGIK